MMRISSNRAGLWWDQYMLLLAGKYSWQDLFPLSQLSKTNLACMLHSALHAECSCSHLSWLDN